MPQPTYNPGDVVNGHQLDANGTWVPVEAPSVTHATGPIAALGHRRPFYRRGWFVGAAAFLAGLVIGAAPNAGSADRLENEVAAAQSEVTSVKEDLAAAQSAAADAEKRASEAESKAAAAEKAADESRADESSDVSRSSESSADAGPSSVAVPDVVGMNYQQAQDALRGAGLMVLPAEDALGAGRLPLVDMNWVVVSQDMKPGTTVEAGTGITCTVKKYTDE